MLLKKNFSLKKFNTFNVEVKASLFTEINYYHEFLELLESNLLKDNDYLIIGSGSNILFTKDFEGIVIKNNIKGFEINEYDSNYSLVTSYSGEIWHDFVIKTLDNNLYGLENLSYIPGTVGASAVQNIGAYGVEMKDFFYLLEFIDIENGTEKIYNINDCKFGYRDSIFKKELKNKVFIKKIIFKLNKKPKINISYKDIQNKLKEYSLTNPTPKDISNLVIEIRKSKLPDPNLIGNAGSFFKNPEVNSNIINDLINKYNDIPYYKTNENLFKVPAAWLIEKLDWKGKIFGECGIHKNQALVIVNYGKAKGIDIKKLADEIKLSVLEKFGIYLETEVNII